MANVGTKAENGASIQQHQPGQTQALVPLGQSSAATTIGTDAYRGALEPTSLIEAFNLAEMMAKVGYCGVSSPADALGRIMTGRGLGLSAMQSMRGIYNVNGRPGIDAALMQALCQGSPLCEYFRYLPEESERGKKASFVAKRKNDPELKHSFEIDQAIQMGLLDRGSDDKAKKDNNWNKAPDAMLRARARSELARILFPDIVFGMYSKEELNGGFADVDGVRDPNEIAAEILSKEDADAEASAGRVTPIQVAARDFAKEAEEWKVKLRAASTAAERKALRQALSLWDGVEPYRKQVFDTYNEVLEAAKTAKAGAAETSTASAPTQVGESNLFTGSTKDEAK